MSRAVVAPPVRTDAAENSRPTTRPAAATPIASEATAAAELVASERDPKRERNMV
jgi:hypothetical protein